jgi:hypothetical protein
MQRDILRAYENARPHAKGLCREMDWFAVYDTNEVCGARWLREEVAKLRGGWCETPCYTPAQLAFSRNRQHKPHIDHGVVGWGFEISFARALHTLVRHGVLIAVDEFGRTYTVHGGRHIRAVVRGKC